MAFYLKSCWWYSFQTGRFQSSFCRRRSIRILKNRIKFWREISDFCLLLSPGQRSPVSWQLRAQRSVKYFSFCRPALVCKRSSVCSVVERHFKNRKVKKLQISQKHQKSLKDLKIEDWKSSKYQQTNLLVRWFGIYDDLWFLATRYVQVKIWRISGLPLLNVFPMASFLSDNIWIWQCGVATWRQSLHAVWFCKK